MNEEPLFFWNPYTQKKERELVAGGKLVDLLYGTRWGQSFSEILSHPIFSKTFGAYQSSGLSRKSIGPFITSLKIPMEDYEGSNFNSFNDFFIRKFKVGKRTFVKDPLTLPAFAEGRYLGFDKTENGEFPVKGQNLTLENLLHGEDYERFFGGPLLICRLCPVDYHRFHFPDDGVLLDSRKIKGQLHSVNPQALQFRAQILVENERTTTFLETRNFGNLAYVEVGALCVGKIVQTHTSQSFRRGDEKGYFLFGGSTIIVVGTPGSFSPRDVILEQTKNGLETFVRLGDPVGLKKTSDKLAK